MQLRSSGIALEERPGAAAHEAPSGPARLGLRLPAAAPRRLWAEALRQLTSVRLAIALLIGLGIVAALGTLFPSLDMYHSAPFTALLVLLGLNIAVCSTRRLTTLVRASRQEISPVDDHVQEHAALRARFELRGPAEEVVERVRRTLAGRGLAVRSAEREGKRYLLGEGGRLAPYGPVITHLSFLLILAGAVVGSMFGFATDVNVAEGTSVSSVRLASGRSMPLGFEVRCDEFEVSYYPNSRQPSDYRSDLTVLENGQEIVKKTIRVNDPLSYGRLRFYQSSYGQMPPSEAGGRVVLAVQGPGGASRAIEAPIGTMVPYDERTKILVRQFVGSFHLEDGAIHDHGGLENPAARVAVLQDGRVLDEGWRFLRHPGFRHGKPTGWNVELKDLRAAEYTGLRVSRDPGVGLVYAGGILLSAGLLLSFLQRQRRVWARVEGQGSQVLVSLAARTLRHSAAIEPEFGGIVESLRPAAPEPPSRPAKSKKRRHHP
jgi:cytochrome c biogenesis protein